MPAPFLAAIGVPTAGQCLRVLAPFAALLLLRWILRHIDGAIRHLFPHLEWQRQLGWLNIRAERRAAAFLRSIAYLTYFFLALALYGIVWAADGLSRLPQWRDPEVLLSIQLPVLLISCLLWAIYLAGHLLPKLRRDYEHEELERFRAQFAESEEEESSGPRTAQIGWKLSRRPRR
jgi:hypothetical protein